MFPQYLAHCERALGLYGEHVFTTLSSREHFYLYVRQQKSED